MLRKFRRLLLSWLPLLVLLVAGLWRRGARTSTKLPRRTQLALPPDGEQVLPAEFTRLLLSWLVLLLLGAAEFGASFLPLGRSLRPLVMLPAVPMVGVVAINFMEVGKGPTIVRGFAVAAMFWLIVLLALGSADPLTRTDYLVPHAHAE